jgi:tetratricopeptide (TPR) repeat protein
LEQEKIHSVAMELHRNHPEVGELIVEGQAFFSTACFREALEKANAAIELAPEAAIVWDFKAEVLLNMNQGEKGLECAEKALAIDPAFASSWVNKGWAELQLGRYEDSLQSSSKAIEIDSTHDSAWNNSGIALMMLGRFREGLERVQKALNLNPNNTGAKLYHDAMQRELEHPHMVQMGCDGLSLIEAALEHGQSAALIVDFGNPAVDWEQLTHLVRQYPKFKVLDLLERSLDQMDAMSRRFAAVGAYELSIDLTIRLRKKELGLGSEE